MDTSEFDKFSKHLFVAFPDLWEWLNANSPDVNATLDVWQRSLAGYSFIECMHVLDDWISGKRPPFKAFERSQVAILIRQCVQFDRDREAQRKRTAGESEQYQKTRREDYKPLAQHLPELGKIYREGAKLKRDVMDGKITEADYQERKRKLLENVL